VSFTKAAVNEATSSASEKFGVGKNEMKWFKTLHSLVFSSLGLNRDRVMSVYKEFAKANGFTLSRKKEGIEAVFSERNADELVVYLKSLVDATGMKPEDAARKWNLGNISLRRYDQFCRSLADWKKEKKLVEYSDMLSMFVAEGQPIDVDVAFIDEAQDLTPQQWKMVGIAFRHARSIIIAGDDDQAIYRWAGADVECMLNISGKQIVLDKSYRVPESVRQLARTIACRIKTRKDKEWCSTGDEGELLRNALLHRINIDSGTWMLLGRTAMTLPLYKDELEKRGINYRINGEQAITTDEAVAYKTLQQLRAGNHVRAADARLLLKLSSIKQLKFRSANVCATDIGEWLCRDDLMLSMIKPSKLRFMQRVDDMDNVRVDVSTIHGVKGSEADNVVLSPALSTATTKALHNAAYADSEHRVWYVGATRARKRLFLLRADGGNSYGFGR